MARIGIDIDDTITDTTSTVREYILKYSSEYEQGNILTERLDRILRGFFDHEVINKFFKEHCLEMGKIYNIRPLANEIINKLKEEGNEIYIITARSDKFFIDAEKYCKDYLDSRGILYDKVITSKLFKVEACKEENIDIMIDDGIDTCEDLNKAGIKAYLFTSELNKDKKTSSRRVNSWKQAYNVIHNYINKKESK